MWFFASSILILSISKIDEQVCYVSSICFFWNSKSNRLSWILGKWLIFSWKCLIWQFAKMCPAKKFNRFYAYTFALENSCKNIMKFQLEPKWYGYVNVNGTIKVCLSYKWFGRSCLSSRNLRGIHEWMQSYYMKMRLYVQNEHTIC